MDNKKKIAKIKSIILKKVTPTSEEIKKEKKIAKEMIDRIKRIEGKHVDVILAGSVARNTHLKGDRDLDLFVLFPENLTREEFIEEGLRIGKECLKGIKWEEAYSEHPYLKANVKGFDVEIVPSYRVKKAENLKSSVDRTPFHKKYLLKKLNDNLRKEVRVLKQFLKGTDLYGADLKVQGFSGYLCELLILEFKSFENLFKSARNWKRCFIDLERHYKKEDQERLFKEFNSDFVVIDPTDRHRNVSAPVSKKQFERFTIAAKRFLEKPDIRFFNPEKPREITIDALKRQLRLRNLIALKIAKPDVLSDILWGQIKRFGNKVEDILKREGFKVVRHDSFVGNHIILLFEMEELSLPKIMSRTGPFASDDKNVKAFLAANKVDSEPRIENERIVIDVKRKRTTAKSVLKDYLKEVEKESFRYILEGIKKKAEVIEEKEIKNYALKNKDFRIFLNRYFKGKENFF